MSELIQGLPLCVVGVATVCDPRTFERRYSHICPGARQHAAIFLSSE